MPGENCGCSGTSTCNCGTECKCKACGVCSRAPSPCLIRLTWYRNNLTKCNQVVKDPQPNVTDKWLPGLIPRWTTFHRGTLPFWSWRVAKVGWKVGGRLFAADWITTRLSFGSDSQPRLLNWRYQARQGIVVWSGQKLNTFIIMNPLFPFVCVHLTPPLLALSLNYDEYAFV